MFIKWLCDILVGNNVLKWLLYVEIGFSVCDRIIF